MASMESFLETKYVVVDRPTPGYTAYDPMYMPYATTMVYDTYTDAYQKEVIPEGAFAIERGTKVQATDGHLGQVGELVLDPQTGKITHFVMQKGRGRGKKELTLPLTAIARVEEGVVYLKLDKKAIGMLPAIPIKRHYDKATGDRTMELVAFVYDSPKKTEETLQFIKELDQRGTVQIVNLATMSKDKDGKVTYKDTKDLDLKHGRLFGAIAGGLIGIVGGPVGMVVGAAAGAAAGGVTSRLTDFGFSDDLLKLFNDKMKPGNSAILVMLESNFVQPLSENLRHNANAMFQQTLTDRAVQELMDKQEKQAKKK
jgi:uncharacterized membrane protein/sporulation protein YlmC with PRC-barrel domain